MAANIIATINSAGISSPLAAGLTSIAAAYAFFWALLYFTQDAREPPAIVTTIPFLSPAIGMLLQPVIYFVHLRDKYGLPIYTLRVPGGRLYIVNSLSLVPAVQRQARTIAFAPIEAQAAANVMGLTKAGNAILATDMTADTSYLGTFVKSIHPAMSPGPGLDAINRASVLSISAALDKLHAQGPTTVDLFKWLRHEIFIATTDAVYGPDNPLRDPEKEEAWYKFEPGIMVLMLNLFPRVFARESVKARALLVTALQRYFSNNGHHRGSLLVQCRYKHNVSHGLGPQDVATTEIGQNTAQLTNTVPATFWFMYRVLSDPAVLEDCRREVARVVREGDDGVCTIDLSEVKTSCPILLSTWQEVLRYYNTSIAARVVMADHMLDGRYLLKKGASVMIVNPVQHSDVSVWGPTARDFDHRRFYRAPGDTTKRPSPVAFRGFGGGSTLCPGRHFVTTEVLSFVALVLMRFDVRPVGGDWARPGQAISMTASLPQPKGAVPVEIVPRRDGKQWHVLLTDSDKTVAIVAEDFEAGH